MLLEFPQRLRDKLAAVRVCVFTKAAQMTLLGNMWTFLLHTLLTFWRPSYTPVDWHEADGQNFAFVLQLSATLFFSLNCLFIA